MVIAMVLVMAVGQTRSDGAVTGTLLGMGVAAAGLVAGKAWRMIAGQARNPLGRLVAFGLTIAALLTVDLLRWPLLAVVLSLSLSLSLGSASVLLA
jgi:chromate transport protein ChrA